MKASEARTKWCPFSRALSVKVNSVGGIELTAGGEVSFNRMSAAGAYIDPPLGCNCIAEKCAAWRLRENFALVPKDQWPVAEEGEPPFEPDGFCGAAGERGAP